MEDLNDKLLNQAQSQPSYLDAVMLSCSCKAMKLKFWFRLFAMFDVLFSEKFELITWNKKGEQKSKTKFSKTEIDNTGRSGSL